MIPYVCMSVTAITDMLLLCVCLCADLFDIFSTEGEEGVLRALSLLAVGGDHPHLRGLHPLLLGMMGIHQHAAQLEEERCRQVSLALHAYPHLVTKFLMSTTSCNPVFDVYHNFVINLTVHITCMAVMTSLPVIAAGEHDLGQD